MLHFMGKSARTYELRIDYPGISKFRDSPTNQVQSDITIYFLSL